MLPNILLSLALPLALGVSTAHAVTDSHDFFTRDTGALTGQFVDFNSQELCDVAHGSRQYLDRGVDYDPHAIHAGRLPFADITLTRVKKTLDYICRIHEEDQRAHRTPRLQDPRFISQHFEIIRWTPDLDQARQFSKSKTLLKKLPADQILLTKYYVKKASGTNQSSQKTPYALYGLPHDEKSLSLEQADARQATLTRYRYTKQQILTGILDKKQLATPMVWLSREDLEDTLMQGTVKVDSPAGSQFFNVHRNNGHAYDRLVKKEQQKRYWYFKETKGVMGYGKDADHKIKIHPRVTVAGDLAHLGLGKLVLLSRDNTHRLAILADTGGAFENNHYQLDYLAGYYHGWKDYHRAWKSVPDYFEARILLLKNEQQEH